MFVLPPAASLAPTAALLALLGPPPDQENVENTPSTPDAATSTDIATSPDTPPPAGMRPLGEAIVLDAGASCVERSTVEAHVIAWRDSSFIDERVSIVIRGAPDDPRDVAFVIRWDGKMRAKRRFEAAPERCNDLHAVLGLALAIGLDDTLAASIGIVTPVAPAAPIAIADADQLDLPPRLTPPPDPPHEEAWRVTITPTLLGTLGFGTLPRVSGGGTIAVDLGLGPRVDLRLGALGLAAKDRSLGSVTAPGPSAESGARSVDMTLAAGDLDLCVGMRPGRARLRVCAGLQAGAISADGRGFDTDQTTTLPWLALDAGTDLRVALDDVVGLLVGVRAIIPTLRTGYEVRDASTDATVASTTMAPVGAIISFGFTVDLQ